MKDLGCARPQDAVQIEQAFGVPQAGGGTAGGARHGLERPHPEGSARAPRG